VGNTSSDEIVGHLYAYPLAYELAGAALSPAERDALAQLTLNITLGIARHGYRIIDADGTPTRWGRYDPPSLNDDPAWSDERGLNSLQARSLCIRSRRARPVHPRTRVEIARPAPTQADSVLRADALAPPRRPPAQRARAARQRHRRARRGLRRAAVARARRPASKPPPPSLFA